MPIPNHVEIRYVMLNHFKKNWTSGESYRDLIETYGEDAISISTVKYLFARFRSGDINVEDKERDGRPSELDDNDLLEAVEADESCTTRMLAKEFGVDHCSSSSKAWKDDESRTCTTRKNFSDKKLPLQVFSKGSCIISKELHSQQEEGLV